MSAKKLAVALLLIATGLLAVYAVACPPKSRPLSPNWGIGNRDETIASAREPGPLLGVVHPRE